MGLMVSTFHQKRIGKVAAGVMLFILPFLFSCSATPTQEGGQSTIDPAMVISFMKEKNSAVIDTMSYLECMDHRIPGSHCIALEEVNMKLYSSFPDKSRPLIFYCESDRCPRAGLAYKKAKLLGYKSVYVLEDGLGAWKRAGYEVETIQRVKRAPVISIKSTRLEAFKKEKEDLFILDIRPEDAFKENHIDGAKNIPFYLLHKRLKEIPKHRPVFVIDENGKRSFLACCYLTNNGVEDVIRLFGGMEALVRQKSDKG
jgi:rhodanese-related sulfurtransferase